MAGALYSEALLYTNMICSVLQQSLVSECWKQRQVCGQLISDANCSVEPLEEELDPGDDIHTRPEPPIFEINKSTINIFPQTPRTMQRCFCARLTVFVVFVKSK